METPYSKAWLAFATGDGGESLTDDSILRKDTPDNVRFLQNRMKQAFAAGWNARGDVPDEVSELAGI